VWKGRDTRVDRVVAIKRLKGEHAQRFKHEARAIAALNHPHVCQLYDVGPDYLSAPMLSSDATISAALTGPAAIVGTVAYMSPEQAQGQPVDTRSDVFSFGAVLYELLSGRQAFAGDTPFATLAAVVHETPPPLEAPAALERIVGRCLAKQPHDRFQSMAEVGVALERTVLRSLNQIPSIAVLPFSNMSRDADDEFFSDGLAEELINLLAHVPNLKVTARTSSFAFRGKEQDIRRIAEALGVQTILEGGVRRAGNRIRVTAQLINADDGYHLWSERYDRELTDVFAIQDEIAQAICVALQRSLVAKPARHSPLFPAYEALLKARHHLRIYAPETYARAREYCEEAIALDPAYAAPHALLGFILLQSTTQTGMHPAVAAAIRRKAQRALELDPLDSDPHFLLGAVAGLHDYDWGEAERELKIALASPSAPAEAHWVHACVLSTFGRFEESAAEMRRTVELDPLTPLWRGILVAHLVCAAKYEEALDEGRKGLAIGENQIHPLLGMAEAYLALGRIGEACAAAEQAYRNIPQHSMGAGCYAASLVRVGEQDRAAALVREIGDTPIPIWGRAWYHLLCSEMDEAARWYEEMIKSRELFAPVYANSLYTAELRTTPYWAKLARMMNLPESLA
jgi:serine/threonine-protein kinase